MARINLNIPNRWNIKFIIRAQERTVNRSSTIFLLLILLWFLAKTWIKFSEL